MNNNELRDKLNELEQLEDLQYFINKHGENFRCIIKKDIYCFSGIFTEKSKMKVSRKVLNDFIEYQSEILKEEIERLKKEY